MKRNEFLPGPFSQEILSVIRLNFNCQQYISAILFGEILYDCDVFNEHSENVL